MRGAKACTKCREEKKITEFGADKTKTDGFCSQCKVCRNSKSIVWKRANRERQAAARKAWRAANGDRVRSMAKVWQAENPEKVKSYAKAWRDANPEIRAAYSKTYREANLERKSAIHKAWCQANPERKKAYDKANPDAVQARGARRRARKRSADGHHTVSDLRRIRAEQKDLCAYCDVPLGGKGHADHIWPLAKGGSNWPDNLQLLCGPCNIRKGARNPAWHIASLGLISPEEAAYLSEMPRAEAVAFIKVLAL